MSKEINQIGLDELKDETKDGAKNVIPFAMDLVGHLPVDVNVHVGSVEISIEKLFSMKAGDTLKLREELDAPIRLVVDGKTVALGNLVAVDENFGIQITEVAKN